MSRSSLLFVIALLGCGGSSPPPAKSPPPMVKPLRASRSGVLFVVDYEALLPVACYDERTKRWDAGEKCLEVLPDDATVQLESGRTAKVGGHRVPTITGCTLSTKLLMFENAASESPGTYALWPPSGEGRVRRVDWGATKGGSADFHEAERARLGRALNKITPSDTVSVVQIASADLDANGESEILYSVNGAGFDPATRKGISALFVAPRGVEEMIPVRTSDHAVFRVEGIVDIDDDGLSEIWISERTYHPNGMRTDSMTVAWHAPGGLTPLSPIESCYPPAKVK